MNGGKSINHEDKRHRRHQKIFFAIFIPMIFTTIILSIINLQIYSNTNGNIKVMVWNIHGGYGTDGDYDIDRIIDDIKDQDPDILGLTEFVTKINISDFADELDMHYYFAEAGDTNEGNALLSKYPINDIESFELPLVETSRARVLIKAEIKIENKDWEFYITHLSRFGNSKDHEAQIEYILSKIEKHQKERVVIMGDLNFRPGTALYFKLLFNNEIQLRDTYSFLNDDSGNTMRSNYPIIRIDYILSSVDLIPTNSEVMCTSSSDHCPIITEF